MPDQPLGHWHILKLSSSACRCAASTDKLVLARLCLGSIHAAFSSCGCLFGRLLLQSFGVPATRKASRGVKGSITCELIVESSHLLDVPSQAQGPCNAKTGGGAPLVRMQLGGKLLNQGDGSFARVHERQLGKK